MADNSESTEAPSAEVLNGMQFHQAFERQRLAIENQPEDDLEPVNLNIPATLVTVLGATPKVMALRPDLAPLSTFDIANVDNLRDFAGALGHAHAEFRAAGEPPNDTSALVERMIDARELYRSDAAALARRGLLDAKRVAAHRGGNSHKMIAFDVIGLAGLLLEKWEAIEGRSAIERQELEQARCDAYRLIEAVGRREQAPRLKSEATLLRQKAYTLLVRAYNETRQAITFVRRKQGDVDEITPSLYAGRGKRPPKLPTALPEPTPPASTPPAPLAIDTAADVPVGYPGSKPLS